MTIKPEECGGGSAVEEAPPELKSKEPAQFAVVLHNDDYTTMEFVVEILKQYFRKTEEQAHQVMLQVHQQGKGVAGLYSHEIAETKVAQVHLHARAKGFPLLCSLEPRS